MEWTGLGVAIALCLILAGTLWGPYLYKEIRRGKVQLGPRTPPGAGDNRPGGRRNPAPGQPDAQADPYDATERH